MSVATKLEERGRFARRQSTWVVSLDAVATLGVSVGIWALIVVASAAIAAIESMLGDLEVSTLQSVLPIPRVVLFVAGAAFTGNNLLLHLAVGGTRRSFVDGLLTSSVFLGLATGLMTAVLVLVERLAWGAIGWDWQFNQGLDGNFAVTVVSEALAATTYLLAGAMLPAAYQRFGAWGGSSWILVLLALILFVDWSVHAGYFFGSEVLAGAGTGRTLFGLGGGVLAVALAAFGVDRFYRDIPLRSAIG